MMLSGTRKINEINQNYVIYEEPYTKLWSNELFIKLNVLNLFLFSANVIIFYDEQNESHKHGVIQPK